MQASSQLSGDAIRWNHLKVLEMRIPSEIFNADTESALQ